MVGKKRELPPCTQRENKASNSIIVGRTDYSTVSDGVQEEIVCKFSPKKVVAVALADIYAALASSEFERGLPLGMDVRAQRVRDCGSFLEFIATLDARYLHRANFCKDKLCPLCNWRRSLKMFAQVSQIMDVLEKDGYRFLFLTLTVRNCPADGFGQALTDLLSGWKAMQNRKPFSGKGSQILGTLRILETTYNAAEKTYHPHLHIVLAVKPSYFKGGHYITQAKWVEYWRAAMKLDYDPIVHVETVKPIQDNGYGKAVAEVSKYPFKSADWYNREGEEQLDVVSTLFKGLHGRRLTGFSGVFREARNRLALDDVEDGDLVHTDIDQLRPDVAYLIIRARWQAGTYVLEEVQDKSVLDEAILDVRKRGGGKRK